MPKKGGKKKAKEPAFLTSPADTEPFGCNVNDLIITPMGIQVTVVGVKKSEYDIYHQLDGTLWATFPGGFNSPLRAKSAEEFELQGYRRAHEGIHILRDKEVFEVKRQELLDAHNPILQEEAKKAKAEKKEAKGAKKKKK